MSTNKYISNTKSSLTLGRILTFARLHYYAPNYQSLLNDFITSNGIIDDGSSKYEISQVQASEIIGISNETLSRYECDSDTPKKLEICLQIASFYKINVIDFIIHTLPEYRDYLEESANTYRNNVSTKKIIELEEAVYGWISKTDSHKSDKNIVEYVIRVAQLYK